MQHLAASHRGLSLNDLLSDSFFFGGTDVCFSSCCIDAKQCQPGDLFVAVLDDAHDGHESARVAVERGAIGVLGERPLPVSVPMCIVPDSRKALGRVCQALAGAPTQHLDVVGVTGTNGKTITSLLMQSVLQTAGRSTGAATSLGQDDTLTPVSYKHSTPSPPELADWMARMVATGCSSAVLEVSSLALSRHYLTGVQLDAAIVTNLRRDHTDHHGSVMNYRRIQTRILSHLSPEGFLVINGDDAGSKLIESKAQNPIITVALHGDAEIRGTVLERYPSEQIFLIEAGRETIPVRTQIIGDQHIYSCLQVAAAGLVMGIDLPTIVRGLEAVSTVPGRMERVECGQPFSVFVDLANTPDRLAVCLKNLRRVTRGRLICVYGPNEHRDAELRPLLGRVAEKGADVSIITASQAGLADSLPVVHDVLDGYDRVARAHVMPDREHAITYALEQARPGDTVLLAGQGDELYRKADQHPRTLDDRDIAENWLYEVGSQRTYEAPEIAQRMRVLPLAPHVN